LRWFHHRRDLAVLEAAAGLARFDQHAAISPRVISSASSRLAGSASQG